ncbi:MAG TPA: hypothetical protein VM368_04675 [Flavisolibacter sp.]|nr:hypothetical protein [Flavisolibacter sp.]
MQNKNNLNERASGQDGNLGRTNDPNDQVDISRVDQQEGNLDHGETGGNFNNSNTDQDRPNQQINN